MRTARNRINRLSAWLGLIAVIVQCFVVQTHVHGSLTYAQAHTAAALKQASLAETVAAAPQDGQGAPSGSGSNAQCLLCQSARASVSALTAPPVFAVLIRTAFIATPPEPALAPFSTPRSHSWQSRAPPSLA